MRTIIVTGAYGVIGREIAKGLVKAHFHTILIGRDKYKLKQLQEELLTLEGASDVDYHAVDLSSKAQIYDMAEKIDAPIDVLVNNAATAPRSKSVSEDGIEMQWATNVLGYYWMIDAFEAHLTKAKKGRVVNVASYWAGGLDLDDPEFKNRPYDNDQAYRQSKQADRMLTYGFADKLINAVTVNVCHSGDANSKLSNNLGFGGSVSPRQAAETPLYLAISSEVNDVTGAYFAHGREARCQFRSDKSSIDRLMKICGDY